MHGFIELSLPSTKRFYLLATSTLFSSLGVLVMALSIGTDHWREIVLDPQRYTTVYNDSVITQGLVHECHKKKKTGYIVCYSLKKSEYLHGKRGYIDLSIGFLIGGIVAGFFALLLSVISSFYKRHSFVVAVLSFELVSTILGSIVMVIYSTSFIKDTWKPGWSYALGWLSVIGMLIGFCGHFVANDVKFTGKQPPPPPLVLADSKADEPFLNLQTLNL